MTENKEKRLTMRDTKDKDKVTNLCDEIIYRLHETLLNINCSDCPINNMCDKINAKSCSGSLLKFMSKIADERYT